MLSYLSRNLFATFAFLLPGHPTLSTTFDYLKQQKTAEKIDTNAQWFHCSWSILLKRVNIRVRGFHLVLIGEDEPNLTRAYFFRWVGSTTNIHQLATIWVHGFDSYKWKAEQFVFCFFIFVDRWALRVQDRVHPFFWWEKCIMSDGWQHEFAEST